MLEDKPIKGLLPKYCEKCRWRSVVNNSCDYILFDGNGMRGCPPGEGCFRREIGKRGPVSATVRRQRPKQVYTAAQADFRKAAEHQQEKSAEINDRRMKLYSDGMTDEEMTKAEGVEICTIRRWRKKHNLPPNKHGFNRLTREEEDKRLALWNAGMSYSEMAKTCGVHVNAMFRWAQLRGLSRKRK